MLANTIDAGGAHSIARRFLLGLAWIGGGTVLGALLPLLGVAVFASFIIFFWLPISGEIGAPGPRPAHAGETALSPVTSLKTQPRADHPAPAGKPRPRPPRRERPHFPQWVCPGISRRWS
jgi:hypothetical protein